MEWTTDSPVDVGWYWFLAPSPTARPQVVKVEAGGWVYFMWGQGDARSVTGLPPGALWAGPLPVPGV